MTDEHYIDKGQNISSSNSKKKENIRVFVQRKRALHHGTQPKKNNIEQLTSFIEKYLNTNKKNYRNNKNIVIVNYKPVYTNSHQQKCKTVGTSPLPVDTISCATQTNHSVVKKSITNPNNLTVNSAKSSQSSRPNAPFKVPDVEDPLVFIEMMYQQLFTEDGQLRSETEPRVLANCVKEIITQSRRNSLALKDPLLLNKQHEKYVLTPFDSTASSKRPSICMLNNKSNKNKDIEEDFNELLQTTRTPHASLRSSKRSSIDNFESHLQELHAFVNSYHQDEKKPANNANNIFSFDDTDNEDFDEFSEMNSLRKPICLLSPTSFDDEMTHTDSKLLLSSGYQSLHSPKSMNLKTPKENNSSYCPHCIDKPKEDTIKPITSINIVQPMRDVVIKIFNFVFISKNILLLPLFMFLLRQRSMMAHF